MNLEKQILGELPMAYAVCVNRIGSQAFCMAATELHGPCHAYFQAGGRPVEVWDRPGGVMSLLPLGDGSGRLLAIQQAWPIYHFEQACVVDVRPRDASGQSWESTPVLDLPFAHRIALFGRWVIGATLASKKAKQEDWSSPGSVVAAPITSQWGTPLQARVVFEGIRRNHGMTIARLDGRERLFVSGMDGLFMLTAPEGENEPWPCDRLLDHDVSDVAVFDLDGDGQPELLTIEPFHGNRMGIYKRSSGHTWQKVVERPLHFGHVVWAGDFAGQPTLIVGNRGGDKDLTLLRPRQTGSLDFNVQRIDTGGGPTNIALFGPDAILAANHAAGQVVLYRVSDRGRN